MDNFNTTDMDNYAKKMDEKFADKAADKVDYQEFKDNFKDLVEKTFEDKMVATSRLGVFLKDAEDFEEIEVDVFSPDEIIDETTKQVEITYHN